MGLTNYNPGIKLGAGLTPAGSGNFPLMQACDILVGDDNKRLDAELLELRRLSGSEGLPLPKEVSTEAEMNDILASATADDIGSIYKYTGVTTNTYEHGALYILSGDIPDGDEVSY